MKRAIHHHINRMLFRGKVIVIYGARRVGKTTLVKQILSEYPDGRYLNCELEQNRVALGTTNTELLLSFLGKNSRLVVLDEAQYIRNIGMVAKVLVDTFPQLQIILTGSSGFNLVNAVSEPLTGRSRFFHLQAFSFGELLQSTDLISLKASVDLLLRFGSYPEVYSKPPEEAIEELNNIAVNYLYKDLFIFENIRKSDLIRNLVRALALQLGNEVSLNELARMLGENVHTIKRYIELLEQSFIIFRLPSFGKNLRNEIGKGMKVYFYDTGIRNSIIQNFNPIDLRADAGALWENFFITERIKYNTGKRSHVNSWFWRTYQKNEIDYLEESGGKISAFECKYNFKKLVKAPKVFQMAYPEADFHSVNPDNFWKYLIDDAVV